MPKATWNGTVVAQCDKTIVVDSSHYFPLDAVASECLRESDTRST
jgi:uncharacterized protein (DUF427 family)